MFRAPRLLLAASGGASLVVACNASSALESDPAHWDPPARHALGPVPETGDAGSTSDSACRTTPSHLPQLVTSTPGGVSHRPGQPCLESCHEPGGSALLVFVAAGTMFRAQLSREVATGGEVHGVAGTTLEVDGCGNFYATADALVASLAASQPYVQNPTFRRMDRKLGSEGRPGSCNQATCHDFSSRLRWGIYF